MPELRSVLERVRDQLVPSTETDPFERLVAYRRRKRNRKRLGAATLAVIVSMAGTAFVLRAFYGSGTPPAELSPGPEFSPHEVTTFPVGPNGQTHAILAADGSVWISAYGVPGVGGGDRDALFRIDPASNDVAATIPMSTAAHSEFGTGMTLGYDSIWVTGVGRLPGEEKGQAILQRVDPATNEVLATIPLGGRDGRDVAANDSGIWVAALGDEHAEVVRVDPATNEVVGRIGLESDYPQRIVAIDGAVMVQELEWGKEGTDQEGPCGFLTAIDPATDAVIAREPVGQSCGLAGLFLWEGRIWATIDRFVPLDPRTTRPVGEGLQFDPHHSPRGFLVPDETGIWYGASNGPDRLTRLDPATGEISEYMELTQDADSAVVLDTSLWTVNSDGTVTRIDLVSPKEPTSTP